MQTIGNYEIFFIFLLLPFLFVTNVAEAQRKVCTKWKFESFKGEEALDLIKKKQIVSNEIILFLGIGIDRGVLKRLGVMGQKYDSLVKIAEQNFERKLISRKEYLSLIKKLPYVEVDNHLIGFNGHKYIQYKNQRIGLYKFDVSKSEKFDEHNHIRFCYSEEFGVLVILGSVSD